MSIHESEILVFDAELKEQRDYWVRRLSRGLEVAKLVRDYERSGGPVLTPAAVPIRIEGDLYLSLCKLTNRSPFLLYTALMAALKICLYKYDRADLTHVGSPSLERPEGAGGAANVLVIADEMDGETTFREFLLKVRATLLEAYGKDAYPFQRLVRDLGSDASADGCPLFEVALVLKGLQGELPEVGNDLTLSFEAGDDAAVGQITYNGALFDRGSVERFAGHLVQVLGEALTDPLRRVREFEMLTASERRQLLVEFNSTFCEYARDRCAHQLFEARAAETPEATALISETGGVSYRELNEAANRLAHRLRAGGVGPEMMVGLMVERGVEMVVALLGVLKAGGAYVPLDPSYPQDRLAFMLSDAGISVLITQRHLLSVLPAHAGTTICMDAEAEELAHEPAANPSPVAEPHNAAYVIYTSGSTGRPKGVMVEHGGLVNYLNWCVGAYRLDEGSGAPVHSPLGFDLTVTSLLAPLVAGRAVTLLPERDGVEALGRALLAGQDFSLVKLTPAHLEALGQLLPDEDVVRATRCLVVGGEALRGEGLEWWRRHAPGVRVVNEYGPTETVVGCCVYEREAGELGPGPVPIGRPIANTRLYVLDCHLQLVAAGVTGELYIGGDGVARGYLNRPALTAERFVPDPFSGRPGARLYRTGDLARRGANGELEFAGRTDEQVKVRGFRIEPGEIETVLLSHPAVHEAVVVARPEREGGARLVAYVVLKEAEEAIAAGHLREYLKERLPDYMLPPSFVTLNELPLTPNGKVNRRALPEPPEAGAGSYVAPRSEMEEVLAGIWSEVLKAERVGVEDDFFELGGHSLLATQIISRVREVLGAGLALRTLFESPTVAGLAAQIESARREQGGAEPLPELAPRAQPAGEPALLSYAQQRLWFLHQLDPESSAYNVPSAARLDGPLNLAALEQALDGIVKRHEVLRATFVTVHGAPRQLVRETGPVRLPLVDLTALGAPAREGAGLRLSAEEDRRPFDLAQGPLLRACLVRLDREEHLLLLTMHHIVADGWSMDVLVREMAEHYKAFATGQPTPLADLPIQYADFAAWQRQLEGTRYRAEQLEYWKERLRAPLPALELPTDRLRPSLSSRRGAVVRRRLSIELAQALHALGRREGATLYMMLLAAFYALLYRYTGQPDLIVGSPVANRERAETQGLIGCLINTVALRTDASGNPSFAELLNRVREVVLGGHAHGEVPHEQVVDAVQPRRSGGDNPLFRVWFVLLGVETERHEGAGLEINPLPVDSGTVQFDLVLSVEERDEELHCAFAYSTDLFDATTIETFAEHYRCLLEEVAAGNTSGGVLDISLTGTEAGGRTAGGGSPPAVVSAPPEEQEQYAL